MDVQFRDMSAGAFERLARRQVDRAFAILPEDAKELPWIGEEPSSYGDRAVQKKVVLQALRVVRWFEFEAPLWAQPLLLKADGCYAMFNGPHQGDRRSWLRGEYGLMLRSMWWDYKRATPFENFCAGMISTG